MKIRTKLTDNEKNLLSFIDQYIRMNTKAPTFKEMAAGLGLTPNAAPYCDRLCRRLEGMRLLRRTKGPLCKRRVRLVRSDAKLPGRNESS